jgi:putative transposase
VALGVQPSMGSVGDAYDNAMAESFFATLECELLDRTRFATQVEGRMQVFEWIEGWYNPLRRHSSIGYQSPDEFERRHDAATAGPTREGSALAGEAGQMIDSTEACFRDGPESE